MHFISHTDKASSIKHRMKGYTAITEEVLRKKIELTSTGSAPGPELALRPAAVARLAPGPGMGPPVLAV